MTLAIVAASALDRAREMKIAKVSDCTSRELHDRDLAPMVDAYRGEEPIVGAMLFDASFEGMMRASSALAGGFDADVLVLTSECYNSDLRENPVTGSRWGQHEMSQVAAEHDGLAMGWVKESLTVMAVNRAGDVHHITIDFKVTEIPTPVDDIVGWELEWGEQREHSTTSADVELTGRIPQVMAKIMNMPGLTQIVAEQGINPIEFGLEDAEEVRAHLDCAAIKAIATGHMMEGALMIHAPEGSVRAEVLKHSLGDMTMTPDQLRERFGLDEDQ